MHTAPTCTSDQVLVVISVYIPDSVPALRMHHSRETFFSLFSPALHPAYGQHSSSRFPPSSFHCLPEAGERATTSLCFGLLTKSTLNRLRSAALLRRPGCQSVPALPSGCHTVSGGAQPTSHVNGSNDFNQDFLEANASRGSWSPVELTQKGDWEGGLRGRLHFLSAGQSGARRQAASLSPR